MERFEYAVNLAPAEVGGFVVTCRDLPQLVTQGESLPDALYDAADAMDEVLAAYRKGGLTFPTPRKARRRSEHFVSPPAGTGAKAALYVAMTRAGISKVQLAKRLGVDAKAIRRLLDPHYGSKLPRIAEAIETIGRRLVIGLDAARPPPQLTATRPARHGRSRSLGDQVLVRSQADLGFLASVVRPANRLRLRRRSCVAALP